MPCSSTVFKNLVVEFPHIKRLAAVGSKCTVTGLAKLQRRFTRPPQIEDLCLVSVFLIILII